MTIPHNIAGVILFALLIASAYGVMSRPVRRWLKFRFIIALIVVLVVLAIISGK